MSRYKVTGEWGTAHSPYNTATVVVQCADITDQKDGRTYHDGAYRVLVEGKPCKRGKGGTVPFYGEMAWADADRLASDIIFERRFK